MNFGIKVPPEQLIDAYRQHMPDAIGLSGLLVKSAQQMVITADDLRKRASAFRCWSAARRFLKSSPSTRLRRAMARPTCYAKDAMTGLRLMNEIMDPVSRAAVLEAHTHTEAAGRRRRLRQNPWRTRNSAAPKFGSTCRFRRRRTSTARSALVPQLPELWSYINPFMLYGRHLGLQRKLREEPAQTGTQSSRALQHGGRAQAATRCSS